MFLSFISTQLGFLETSDEAGVFLEFPLDTRKVLAREVVGVFINKGIKPSLLSSPSHVRCVMELVGQSFSLPIAGDTVDIISSATELYRRWLLEDKPPPLKTDETQGFIRDIFNHFSQLFHPQAGEEKETVGHGQGEADTLLAHHTNLCSSVLDIYCRVARDVPLTFESWEHLLKVLVGITDSLLNLPKGDDHLSRNLCPLLLKTLFEVWLRSETRGVMWQNLRDLMWHWRHRLPTIQIWNDVCFALTERVLRILYGRAYGTERVLLFDTAELNLTEEHVLYSWFRVLHLLSDLESIPLPENYMESMRGIGRLANLYLCVGEGKSIGTAPPSPGNTASAGPSGSPAVGTGRASVQFRERTLRRGPATGAPPGSPGGKLDSEEAEPSRRASGTGESIGKLKAPDGNTILHILGPFLFDAVNIYKDGFERGKAKALETLCGIFSRRPTTDFDDTYLAYYYRGIAEAVNAGHPLYISTLLLSTMDFFQLRLKGSNILIPTLVTAMKQVLCVSTPFEGEGGQQSGIPPKAVLRKAAIKQMGNVICYASHYSHVPFQRRLDKRNDMKSYDQLNHQLNDLLVNGIQHESDPSNLQALLWTASMFIHETVTENKQFLIEFLRTVLRRVLLTNTSDQVSFTVLQVLTDLACLFDYVEEEPSEVAHTPRGGGHGHSDKGGEKGEITLVAATRVSMSVSLVQALCKFFELKCTIACSPSPPHEDLIIQCLLCIQAWILKGKWALLSPQCLKTVLGVIDKCRGEVKGFHIPTERTRETAIGVLLMMLDRHGEFPTPPGPANVSALLTETELLSYKKDPSKYVTSYMFDKTLLSVIRHSRKEGDTAVTIVVRDLTGRYIWNASMNYFPTEPVMPQAITSPEPQQDRLAAQPPPEPIDYVPSLLHFLDEQGQRQHNQVLSNYKKRIQDEAALLRKKKFGDVDNKARPPERPIVEDDFDSTPHRVFLTQMGLLTLGNRPNFLLLHADPSKQFNHNTSFNILDNAREREGLRIGVLYVRSGQQSLSDILDAEAASAEFYYFLSKVGWTVDLETHNGFKAGLEAGLHGEVVPYYADAASEVIFHVPVLMPSGKDKGQAHKQKILMTDKVVISWVENLEEYDFAKLDLSNAAVNIIVNPITGTDLYNIRIVNHARKTKDLGPLLDGAVVSKYVLPTLARQTAILAARGCSEEGKALTVRKRLIDDFSRRYKSEVSTAKFYASFFPPKKV